MIFFEDFDHGIIFLEASDICISYSERYNMINCEVLNFLVHFVLLIYASVSLLVK